MTPSDGPPGQGRGPRPGPPPGRGPQPAPPAARAQLAQVTLALKQRVAAAVRHVDDAQVTTVRPGSRIEPGSPRVNLYLYRVVPNPSLRNRPPQGGDEEGSGRGRLMAVDIDYVLTFQGDEELLEGQQLLQDVLLYLERKPLLKVPEMVEPVRLTLQALTMEELAALWSQFQGPAALSLAYRAAGVLLTDRR